MKYISCLQTNSLTLSVYVQPKASKNRIAGLHRNSVKICVTAPPTENKANEAVIKFIAGLFRVPKSAVSIKSGRQSRNKKILISNLNLDKARDILAEALSAS